MNESEKLVVGNLETEMHSVPKFVIKRLQERPATAESHPDADLLTAFAEQSLDGRERALVMEHLAACGDCRDVVALALPPTESVALPAAGSAARIGWLTWPTLRWAALAAGILVVTSVGVLQYSHRNQERSVASNFLRKDAAPSPSALHQPPSRQVTVPQSEMRRELAAPGPPILTAHKLALEPNRLAQPPGGAGAGQGVSPRRDSVLAQASESPTTTPGQPRNPTPEIHQQVKVGAASQVVEVQAEATALNTETAATGQNQLAQNQADLPLQGRAFTDLNVVKAKDPVPAQAASKRAAATTVVSGSMPLQTSQTLMLRASPRWIVTPVGALQRSFDGGHTWENVAPSTSLGTADRGRSQEKNQKVEAASSSSSVFRAVAASGVEVWAGASGGALYHSSDGGNRWALVAPSEAGMILTGDITSIQFSDPQHGKIATSTGEIWTTFDAGQTWHRQQ